MQYIGKKIYNHLSINSSEKHFNKDIAMSEPFEVFSYSELVKQIAKITFNNPDINIYYRGQDGDFRDHQNRTVIYPSLFRGDYKERKLNIEKLNLATSDLIASFDKYKIDGYSKLKKFPIVAWSILQHYEVCSTPLLDVTDSLSVACSFALSSNKEGYLYLLGLPHSNGSITYSIEHELFNIKLNSICPPEALRPYYQNGYLIGEFPELPIVFSKANHNFSRRLVAKFKLNPKSFWNYDFKAIPNNALFPVKDDNRIQEITQQIKYNVLKLTLDELEIKENKSNLLSNLYSDSLRTEVINLYLNDWTKEDTIVYLTKRGYSKNEIAKEFDDVHELI